MWQRESQTKVVTFLRPSIKITQNLLPPVSIQHGSHLNNQIPEEGTHIPSWVEECQSLCKNSMREVICGLTTTTGNSLPFTSEKEEILHVLVLVSSSFAVQFSSVVQPCSTLHDPMDCSTPGLSVHHQLLELAQTHVHWVGDANQPSHPLSSPAPPDFNLSQLQGLFQWVSSLHQVTKILELQHQSFQWIFKIDFL